MMLISVTRLTQPTVEPVTVTEAKSQLRIPSAQTVEDDLIAAYISAARDLAERFIDRPICAATFRIVYDVVGGISVYLKYPATAVSSVTYRDYDGVEQTPPFTYDANLNKIFFNEEIYGTDLIVNISSGVSTDFPQSLKQAVLMLVSDLYTGRASAEYSNKAAQMMLMPFANRPIL